MTSRNPSPSEVLQVLFERAAADLRVSCPAEVLAFDATKRMVTVQPGLKRAYLDETGARQTAAPPAIVCVPVEYPSGGGYSITWPLAKGNTGWLVFADGSLDVWLAGRGGVVDPLDDRAHALTDCVFRPGVLPFALVTQAVGACLELGADGAARQGVALGGALASFLGDPAGLMAWLTALAGWAATVTPAFAGGAPPAPPTLASATVKVTP